MGIGALRRHRDYGATDQGAETTEPGTEAEEEGASDDEIEVEQNGSWYTIYRGGEEVEKVQGEDALDEALATLEG